MNKGNKIQLDVEPDIQLTTPLIQKEKNEKNPLKKLNGTQFLLFFWPKISTKKDH
jgi:peroxiredoxin